MIHPGLTAVPGFRVGHAEDTVGVTGCTVVLTPPGTVGGIDRRGGGTSTRQADGLEPDHVSPEVHAVLLCGGSARGLGAANGVTDRLAEQGVGLPVGPGRVPVVPTAVLFDLGLGDPRAAPDPAMARRACDHASAEAPGEGRIGAGHGASAGKILGMSRATRTGLGSASEALPGGGVAAALAVVNPFGDVVDPASGAVVAGARDELGGWADTMAVLRRSGGRLRHRELGNTVLVVVATSAKLDKVGCRVVARMAHDGIARAVRPAHTQVDGDLVVVLSHGSHRVDVSVVGAWAAEVTARAILRGAADPIPVSPPPE